MRDFGAIFVGLTVVDISYYGLDIVHLGRKNQAATAEVGPGGPAANAARVCSNLGIPATLVTALGGAPLSRLAAAALLDSGIQLVDLAIASFDGVPVSAVAVETSGARTIITPVPRELEVFAERSLSGVLPNAPVLIDCHYPRVARVVADLARKRGQKIVLDVGAWKPWTDEFMELSDVAIVSSEFEPDEGSLLRWQNRYTDVFIAISNGPDPVEWRLGQQSGVVFVPQVDAVDTNGAGDVLHGAFMAHLQYQGGSTGWLETAVQALTRATLIATESCTRRGVL